MNEVRKTKYPKLIVDEYTSPIEARASAETSLDDCLALIQGRGYRHLPVMDGEKVLGIISQRDLNLFKNLAGAKQPIQAKDIMHADPFVVTHDTPLEHVVFALSEKKIGSALVRDEAGKVSGIFTTTDAMNALIELLHG